MCVLVSAVRALSMTSRKQNRLATGGANRRIGLNKNVKGQLANGYHERLPLLGSPMAHHRRGEAQPSMLQVVLFWSCVLAGFVWLLLVSYL